MSGIACVPQYSSLYICPICNPSLVLTLTLSLSSFLELVVVSKTLLARHLEYWVYTRLMQMLSTKATCDSHGQHSSYFIGWEEYEKNPYDEVHNPSGIIQMGLAENQVTNSFCINIYFVLHVIFSTKFIKLMHANAYINLR